MTSARFHVSLSPLWTLPCPWGNHPLFPPSLWLEETSKLCPYLGWNLFFRFLALFSRSSGPVPNWWLQNSHDLCWKWVLEVRGIEITSRVTEPWASERLIQWEGSPGGRRTWRQGPGSYRASVRLRLRVVFLQGPPLNFSFQHSHFAGHITAPLLKTNSLLSISLRVSLGERGWWAGWFSRLLVDLHCVPGPRSIAARLLSPETVLITSLLLPHELLEWASESGTISTALPGS